MDELQQAGRKLLRFLDVNGDGLLSVEECQHLKEDTWLFPSEDLFQQVLDNHDRDFLDADALWQLLSERLEADPDQGREWLKAQLPTLKKMYTMRSAKTGFFDSPRSGSLSRSLRGSPTPKYGIKSNSVEEAWEDFCQALQVKDIAAAFSRLKQFLVGEPKSGGAHGSVILYKKLVERLPFVVIPRLQRQVGGGDFPLQDKRVGIVGAGPIGLRAGLELALFGAQVHVFDLREGFYRMNILKLWDWACADLLDLGAKHLLPNFLTYIDHIGIRELQSLLMKLGLLAGVRFSWGTSFKDLSPSPTSKSLQVITQKTSTDSAGRRSFGADEIQSFSALVACDGGNSKVAAKLGLSRVRADGVDAEPSWEVAVVANFENLREPDDRLLEECPRGFSQEELPGVKRLIYLQGETHYFIMTVDPAVLAEHKVLRNSAVSGKELVAADNVDMEKLEEFARQVVEDYSKKVRALDRFFSVDIPEDFWSSRTIAMDPRGRPALSVFAYHADLTWLSQPLYLFDGLHSDLPVFFAGDALREPFWPYGEGCSRGFMGALDTVWAVRSWAVGTHGGRLRSLRQKLFDMASKVDPVNYGKEVLLPFERPVPPPGLGFLRRWKTLSWPAWGFDGRKRAMIFDYSADPSTRYRSYEAAEELDEPSLSDSSETNSVKAKCSLCH